MKDAISAILLFVIAIELIREFFSMPLIPVETRLIYELLLIHLLRINLRRK